jgi:hypothetical protein
VKAGCTSRSEIARRPVPCSGFDKLTPNNAPKASAVTASRQSLIFVLIGSALLFGSAAYVAAREIRPFFVDQVGTQERWHQIAAGQLGSGISAYSQDQLLLDCRAALSSVRALLDTDGRQSGARACLSVSEEVLARNPANALAHYLAAYTNAILGKEAGLSEHLFRSWAIAPNELWLAALRTRLYQEWPGIMGKVQPSVLDADIKVLGTAEEGRKMLVQWYLEVPESRSAITEAVDALDERYRASFVAELKVQANEMR